MTERPLLNVPAVARRLAVDSQTVRRLIRTGTLPALRVGHGYRVEPDALDAFLTACRLDDAS